MKIAKSILKPSLFMFCFVLCLGTSNAQILPKDSYGQYMIYENVDAPGLSKEQLFTNALQFSKEVKVKKSNSNQIMIFEQEGTVSSKGSFLVYNAGSTGHHPDGAVEYHVKIKVKEGSYWFIIGDFLFREYRKNRYGQFEPVNGKYKPLEEEASKLNEKQWEEYREAAATFMNDFTTNLKFSMKNTATARAGKH